MKYRPMQYFNADYNMYLRWLNSTFGTNFGEVKYQEKLDEIRNENTNLYQRMRDQLESTSQQARERQEAIVTAVQRPDEQQIMSDLESRMRQTIRENTEHIQRHREARQMQGGAEINYGNLTFHGLSGLREQYANNGEEIIQSLRQSLSQQTVPEPPYEYHRPSARRMRYDDIIPALEMAEEVPVDNEVPMEEVGIGWNEVPEMRIDEVPTTPPSTRTREVIDEVISQYMENLTTRIRENV
jgi:hypothetical protein